MVERKRKIIWDETPKQFFKEAIVYIRISSSQTDKVKAGILIAIRELTKFPEIHSPDKFRANNANSQLRAFEKFSLRVSYFVSEYEIQIVRIRHVKQIPEMY